MSNGCLPAGTEATIVGISGMLRLALQARPDEGAVRDNLARVLERIEERRRKEKP